MRVVGTAIVLALAVTGAIAHAQGLPTVETSTIDLSPYVQPGRGIRISGTALRRVGGYVVALRSDTILLGSERGAAPDAARPIQLGAVDTLWTRGHWFWPSVALGSSLGATVGGAYCVFGQSDECVGLPIGAVAGFVLGAVVGRARTIWVKKFVRRDGGPVPTIGPWR